MPKSALPGHFIAILILLGLFVPTTTFYPLSLFTLIMPYLDDQGFLIGMISVAITGVSAWCVGLAVALLKRKVWAYEWTWETAWFICMVGGVAVLTAIVSVVGAHGMVGGLMKFGLWPLGLGGYLMWALNRPDVKAWFNRAPLDTPSGLDSKQ